MFKKGVVIMQRSFLMERANRRRGMMGPMLMPGYGPMPMQHPMMGMDMRGQMPMMDHNVDRNMDGRNPYGSKGGYIDHNYQDNRRGRDYAMGGMDHSSEFDNRRDYNNGSDYRGDYHMGNQYGGQYPGSMQFYGYGVGQMPMGGNDYAHHGYSGGHDNYGRRNSMDYADYNDYAMEEKDYKKKLHEWTEKLKSKDRFGVPKEQVLKQAENMGVKFDHFTPEEFYAVYLMMISDYKKVANDYNMYISLAKEWLEDDDVKHKGGDKLCAYLYYIVLGEEK